MDLRRHSHTALETGVCSGAPRNTQAFGGQGRNTSCGGILSTGPEAGGVREGQEICN